MLAQDFADQQESAFAVNARCEPQQPMQRHPAWLGYDMKPAGSEADDFVPGFAYHSTASTTTGVLTSPTRMP